jgi:hypothetical protein
MVVALIELVYRYLAGRSDTSWSNRVCSRKADTPLIAIPLIL